MQYAYENWDHEVLPEEPISNLVASPDTQEPAFSFSDDLKELEARLSMGLEEGLNTYKTQRADHAASPQPSSLSEVPWNEFSRVVANEVLTYLLNNSIQAELSSLRSRLDEYYDDNRTLTQQTQQLVAENERLRKSLECSEKELSRYHLLAGRFFIKD